MTRRPEHVRDGLTAVARWSTSSAVRSGMQAAFLQKDFYVGAPIGVTITSDGVKLAPRLVDTGPSLLSASASGPPVLHGVTGAFSAVEASVYMFGGVLDSGRAAGTVWRWSLDQLRWKLMNVAPPVPSSSVLSVGYTPDGQHLYVLDLDDNDAIGKSLKLARLYRMDLSKGTSSRLLRVPYTGKADFVSIAVMPDGLVALVSSSNGAYKVWRIDGSGDQIAFNGALTGKGRVVSGPVMGEDRERHGASRPLPATACSLRPGPSMIPGSTSARRCRASTTSATCSGSGASA